MRSIRISSAVLFAVLWLTPPAAHANCGAEGCPLVREGLGSSPSRFAFDLRYQDVTQDKLWEGTRSISRGVYPPASRRLTCDGQIVAILPFDHTWTGSRACHPALA